MLEDKTFSIRMNMELVLHSILLTVRLLTAG
jgi:hypothetical protein